MSFDREKWTIIGGVSAMILSGGLVAATWIGGPAATVVSDDELPQSTLDAQQQKDEIRAAIEAAEAQKIANEKEAVRVAEQAENKALQEQIEREKLVKQAAEKHEEDVAAQFIANKVETAEIKKQIAVEAMLSKEGIDEQESVDDVKTSKDEPGDVLLTQVENDVAEEKTPIAKPVVLPPEETLTERAAKAKTETQKQADLAAQKAQDKLAAEKKLEADKRKQLLAAQERARMLAEKNKALAERREKELAEAQKRLEEGKKLIWVEENPDEEDAVENTAQAENKQNAETTTPQDNNVEGSENAAVVDLAPDANSTTTPVEVLENNSPALDTATVSAIAKKQDAARARLKEKQSLEGAVAPKPVIDKADMAIKEVVPEPIKPVESEIKQVPVPEEKTAPAAKPVPVEKPTAPVKSVEKPKVVKPSITAKPVKKAKPANKPKVQSRANLLPRVAKNSVAAQIASCWNSPALFSENSENRITLRVSLNKQGFMLSSPQMTNWTADSFARSEGYNIARRALTRCQPYQLPVQSYASWRNLSIVFGPKSVSVK